MTSDEKFLAVLAFVISIFVVARVSACGAVIMALMLLVLAYASSRR